MILNDMIELYKFVIKMNDDISNNKKDEFQLYIDNVFEKAHIVLKEYIKIFSNIRNNTTVYNWTALEVISYIEEIEYNQKDMRIYLRSINGIHLYPGTIDKDDYETFLNGVIHILVCKSGSREEVHTLLGFVSYCRGISLLNVEEQQYRLKDEANKTLKELEVAWETVCMSYNKIKLSVV